MVQLSFKCMPTKKPRMDVCWQGKSLLLSMLSRLVIAFLSFGLYEFSDFFYSMYQKLYSTCLLCLSLSICIVTNEEILFSHGCVSSVSVHPLTDTYKVSMSWLL